MIASRIILNRKIRPLVYIYIMILIICALSLIIVCMLFHYKEYYFFKGTVIEEDDSYYLKCYIPIFETKYITLNDTLITDKKTYKYILNINLDNKYRYNNLVLNLKLLKEDKMVIEYLKELGGTK